MSFPPRQSVRVRRSFDPGRGLDPQKSGDGLGEGEFCGCSARGHLRFAVPTRVPQRESEEMEI